MEIKTITSSDEAWIDVQDYAEKCSWSAGRFLATAMARDEFKDWERVIVAGKKEKIYGYCTVAKTDCIPDVGYTPYIGYLFVDEEYRGNRLSEKLIRYAMEYLKSLGFDRVYIVSDHENLYEKYGFEVIDRKVAPWGEIEKIYIQKM